MPATLKKEEEQICGNCVEARKEAGLEPNLLITLARRTAKKRLMIRVCPDCDGDIAKIAEKNESDS